MLYRMILAVLIFTCNPAIYGQDEIRKIVTPYSDKIVIHPISLFEKEIKAERVQYNGKIRGIKFLVEVVNSNSASKLRFMLNDSIYIIESEKESYFPHSIELTSIKLLQPSTEEADVKIVVNFEYGQYHEHCSDGMSLAPINSASFYLHDNGQYTFNMSEYSEVCDYVEIQSTKVFQAKVLSNSK